MGVLGLLTDWLGGDDSPTAVFHPGVVARGPLFVGRAKLVKSLLDSIAVPGKQVFIHGAPGTGKTSLAIKAADDAELPHVLVKVPANGTFEDIVAAVCPDLLGKREASVEAGVNIAGIAIGGAVTTSFDPRACTPAVAQAIVGSGRVVIVDDLERISRDSLPAIADLCKKCSDCSDNATRGKLICIAATRSAEPLLLDRSARDRVDVFSIPPLHAPEMREISLGGFSRLRIESDVESLRRIHYHACGFPRVLHEICLSVAREACGVHGQQRRIFPYIQSALESMRGNNAISHAISAITSKLTTVAHRVKMDAEELCRCGVVAAMMVSESFSYEQLSDAAAAAKLRFVSLPECCTALRNAGIFAGDHVATMAFADYEDRLALRFEASKMQMSAVRESASFKREYEGLDGLPTQR